MTPERKSTLAHISHYVERDFNNTEKVIMQTCY